MSISGFPRVVAALARGAMRAIAGVIGRGLQSLGLINWIRRKFAPLTSGEAGMLSRLTRQYLSAGVQQNALPVGASINPANVPSVTAAGMPFDATGPVQFEVRFNWQDPVSGHSSWATGLIDAAGLLTNFDLLARVQSLLPRILSSSDPNALGRAVSLLGFSVQGIVQA